FWKCPRIGSGGGGPGGRGGGGPRGARGLSGGGGAGRGEGWGGAGALWAEGLRGALAELPGVSQPIVRAFIMRRRRLERDKEFAGLRIVAQDGSREGRQLDDFLDKNHLPHRLITFER